MNAIGRFAARRLGAGAVPVALATVLSGAGHVQDGDWPLEAKLRDVGDDLLEDPPVAHARIYHGNEVNAQAKRQAAANCGDRDGVPVAGLLSLKS